MTAQKRQQREFKFQVNHPMHSGGPKFTSLSEALRYLAHCMKEGNGNDYMTIARIGGAK